MKKSNKSLRFRWLLLFVSAIVMTSLYVTGSFAKEAKALVDLNTASQQDLEGLKGVGAVTAKKIIENRPYKSVDELSKAGLSAKKIEALKPFVTAGPAAPAPAKGVTKPAQTPAPPSKTTPVPKAPSAVEKQAAPTKLAPGQKVNINTASKEQLEALPGIGPVKAQAIIDGRPYSAPEDIMKVKGIKEGSFNKVKDLITVK